MESLIREGWTLFCVFFGVMLVLALVLKSQSRYFYTKDVVVRTFSIMDLEFPGSPLEISNVIKGIFALPVDESKRSLKALKSHLYTDFLFMPAANGSIFILCVLAGDKMSRFGQPIFLVLAWLQVVSWICDIIQNIYLLQKLHPEVLPSEASAHKAFQLLENVKWGILLAGAISSLFAFFYYWLAGKYLYISLHFFVIIVAELILFILAGKILYEKSKAGAEEK